MFDQCNLCSLGKSSHTNEFSGLEQSSGLPCLHGQCTDIRMVGTYSHPSELEAIQTLSSGTLEPF